MATSGVIGRPTGLQLGTSGSPTADQSVTYAYDTYGRLNSLAAASQTFNYSYAGNSNLVATVTNSAANYTDTRAYDATHNWIDNRQTQVSTATPAIKAEFAYTQDNLGRTTNVARTGEVFTRYGNGTEGLKTTYGYDDRSQVTSEVTKVGATATVLTGRDNAFAYDTMGNRASTAGTTHNGNAAAYTTNALNQYTQRTVPGVFDVAGAAASSATVTVNSSSTGVMRHGDYFFKGHSLSNSPNPVFTTLAVSDGTTTYNLPAFLTGTPEAFAYDDDGNLLSDGRWDYAYDAENRLISAQTHTSLTPSPLANADARKLEFKNDYLGRRVEKLVRSGWNGTSFATVLSDEKLVYNGWNLMARLNAASSNALLASYYWGMDLGGAGQTAGGIGGLLLIQDSGVGYLPAYDGNGNLHGLIKASDGSLAAAYEYDAFGQTLRESGPYAASNPFRFSTKFTDTETGLVYYGLRYYSPSMGRFINKDPIEESGGLNLYGFCGNNGVGQWDYLGMDEGTLSPEESAARLQAHQDAIAQYELIRTYVDAVYGKPANWGHEGYGSSLGIDVMLAMQLSDSYQAGVSIDHGRLISSVIADSTAAASDAYDKRHGIVRTAPRVKLVVDGDAPEGKKVAGAGYDKDGNPIVAYYDADGKLSAEHQNWATRNPNSQAQNSTATTNGNDTLLGRANFWLGRAGGQGFDNALNTATDASNAALGGAAGFQNRIFLGATSTAGFDPAAVQVGQQVGSATLAVEGTLVAGAGIARWGSYLFTPTTGAGFGFWSGTGGRATLAAAGIGQIASTPFGQWATSIEARFGQTMTTNLLWRVGSAPYAANAALSGRPSFYAGTGAGYTWVNIERPVLTFLTTNPTVLSTGTAAAATGAK